MSFAVSGRRLLLLLALALGAGWSSPALHAQDAATPEPATVELMGCRPTGGGCERGGLSAAVLASDQSEGWWWAIFRATLTPGSTIVVAGQLLPTNFTVSVEEGTLGLTAQVPVICTGSCVTAGVSNDTSAATPGSASEQAQTVVPAGTEVLLGPGDTAVFSEPIDVGHVYRNAGSGEVRFVSTVSGPPDAANGVFQGICYGRCLSPV